MPINDYVHATWTRSPQKKKRLLHPRPRPRLNTRHGSPRRRRRRRHGSPHAAGAMDPTDLCDMGKRRMHAAVPAVGLSAHVPAPSSPRSRRRPSSTPCCDGPRASVNPVEDVVVVVVVAALRVCVPPHAYEAGCGEFIDSVHQFVLVVGMQR